MDAKFEDILKGAVDTELERNGIERHKASSWDLGKALTNFYLKEIGQFLYQINEDDIDDNTCDAKGDLGIDYVHQKDDEWVIFQSKYKGAANHVSGDEIAGFFKVYSKITDPDYFEKHANDKLKELLMDFKIGDTIQFVFITNDKVSPRIEEDFNKFKDDEENKNEFIFYEFKSFTDIKRDYKSVTSEIEAISDVKINIETFADTFVGVNRSAYLDLSSVIDKEKRYKSIICTLKGTVLQMLWLQHKSRLFSYNIRGYLGENAINKKIRDSIKNEPDKFYFFNNGISAICTEILPEIVNGEIKAFNCKNFSIINGAQTTNTIGKFKDTTKLSQVRVLLKLTKAEDYKKEKGLNKKIITYNNSQTVIKDSDFRSNDEIQVFLEGKLKDFKYKGTRPFQSINYLRKRIKVNKNKDTIYIPLEILARVLYVFDNNPILIFSGTKALFDIDTENGGQYWIIFGIDGQECDAYDNKRLEKTIGVYFLWLRVEQNIKAAIKRTRAEKSETIEYQSLLAKWHFLWAFGYILDKFYKKDLESIIKKIAYGKLFESPDPTFIERWFSKIHKVISKCIEKKYQQNQREGNTIRSFNFKNWLRSTTDFEDLILEFKYMEQSDFPI